MEIENLLADRLVCRDVAQLIAQRFVCHTCENGTKKRNRCFRCLKIVCINCNLGYWPLYDGEAICFDCVDSRRIERQKEQKLHASLWINGRRVPRPYKPKLKVYGPLQLINRFGETKKYKVAGVRRTRRCRRRRKKLFLVPFRPKRVPYPKFTKYVPSETESDWSD